MSSAIYRQFAKAMARRQQVVCMYKGFEREICPVILGHKNGREAVFAFQFGGGSQSGLRPGGDWRCLELADVSEVRLRVGPWRTGVSHRTAQRCIDDVDLDVNPDSPYKPKRAVGEVSSADNE